MLEKYPKGVKIVSKNFPLEMHKFSRKASAAALAAQKQGKFWEYHQKIFENSSGLNDQKFLDFAKELNLDLDKFKKDMEDLSVLSQIGRDLQDGNQAGVHGTPTIFVNGKLFGNRSLQGFEQMIDAELKKKVQ